MSTDKSTAAPAKGPASPGPVPPDEKFWQRYSPHHEAPLSGVGSFTIHVLAVAFVLFMIFVAPRFASSHRPPVEAVQLDYGGGGGRKGGSDDDSGSGARGTPKEDVRADPTPDPAPKLDTPKALDLDPGKAADTKVTFDDELARYVSKGNETANSFKKLDELTRQKLLDGLGGSKGKGGPGTGGGKDGGKGTGVGEGQGPGTRKSSLTQREKRMLRWSMTFDTRDGRDYLNQLAGLGAILALPTDKNTPPSGYYVIREPLRRPVELKEGDVSQIKCIFWVDDRPDSVKSLLNALGVNLDITHFVAFMPPAVEEKLYQIERDKYGRREDEIYETKFKVRRTPAGRFEPYVVSQTAKSGAR
jgi:hypothetical protein